MSKKARVFSREFKLMVVRRMLAGEPVRAAPEGPAEELEAARRRVAELERKIGQQQVELDFFRQALRQVGQARQPSDGLGVPASTRSSRRRRPGRKAS